MFYRKLQQQTYKLKQTGTHKWINRTSDIWRLWYSVFHQWLSSVLFEMHFKSIIHKTQCNIGTQNAFEVILVLAGIRVMVIKVLITDNRTVLFFFFFTVEWETAGKGEEDGSTPASLENRNIWKLVPCMHIHSCWACWQ